MSLERIEARDRESLLSLLKEAGEVLEPFAGRYGSQIEEHSIAAEVGGHVPLDDDFPVDVSLGACSRAAALSARIKAMGEGQ